MIQGGLGVAAGANLNPEGVSMFEPIHGSAPKYAGKNKANPLATICAGQMMLEELGEAKAAALLDKAIYNVLGSGRIPTLDARGGLSTSEVGDLIAEQVRALGR
jgi:isocitrate/isopropylmalate dehydrogenase